MNEQLLEPAVTTYDREELTMRIVFAGQLGSGPSAND